MSILDKITKTKITRTPDELTLKVFPMWAIMLFYAFICLSLIGLIAWMFSVLGWNPIAFTFFALVIFAYSFGMVNWLIHKIHSYNLVITGNKLRTAINPKAPKFANTILQPPFFIDFFVITTNNKITVKVENQAQKLGLFRLSSADDLTTMIDSFTELLDLELVDSYKLSNKELLSFKSRQKAIAPYSAFQVLELKNNLTIRSIVKNKEQIEFDFRNNQIKKGRKIIDVTDIQRILIVNYKEQNKLAIELKNGKIEIIFKNKTTEITAIRDAQRLKTILEKQKELSEIEIKTVNN